MKKEDAKRYIERRGYTIEPIMHKCEIAGTPVIVRWVARRGNCTIKNWTLNGLVHTIKALG